MSTLNCCEDCFKEVTEFLKKSPISIPYQEDGISVERYSRMFKLFISANNIPITTELKNKLFIVGLSENNKKILTVFRLFAVEFIQDDNFISKFVQFISPMEKSEV